MRSYKNKKVLIIGGSEGIGLALAKELVREGANVTIASRNQDKLNKALGTLSSLTDDKNKVQTLAVDVTDFSAAKTALEIMVEKFGVPELLINSAGIAHPRYIDDIHVDEINQMMSLNAMGPMYSCRILLPMMIENGGGQVLNVSSVAGYIGLFGYTSYCASKAAVIAFSEALREEMVHLPIAVSVLCPPNTKTPGLEKENEKKPAEVLATEEKVKVLEPEEVAIYTLKKLKRDKFWIIPTFDSQMAYYLKRFAPSVLRMFVKRPLPTKSAESTFSKV